MTVIESSFRIEFFDGKNLKVSLAINDGDKLLFNESVPLKMGPELLKDISSILKWDFIPEESQLFFSKSFKGIYNYIEVYNNVTDKDVATIINKLYLNFLKYRDSKIVFKEKASYEEYFNYE